MELNKIPIILSIASLILLVAALFIPDGLYLDGYRPERAKEPKRDNSDTLYIDGHLYKITEYREHILKEHLLYNCEGVHNEERE